MIWRTTVFISILVANLANGVLTFGPPFQDVPGGNGGTSTLQSAGTILKDIVDAPDGIPKDLLDKANCVIVFPSILKAAFIVGGSDAHGGMTCRSGETFNGPWGAPSMMVFEGGTFRFQAGGEAADFILLVMNDRGANEILKSKVKLGGDTSAAAGPVGRDAAMAADASQHPELLTYARARGVFSGASLVGSSLKPDNEANERIYGERIPAEDIVLKRAVPIPPSARLLLSVLDKQSPRKSSK